MPDLGFSPDKTDQKLSLDDKIKQLQQEVQQIDGSIYSRTSDGYGTGENVEIFTSNKYNMHENKELRALERRLPKNWKKLKWTPRTS